MVWLTWTGATCALGQQIGASTEIEDMVDFGGANVDHNAINVAVTTADGEYWFAVEHAEWDHSLPWDDIENELELYRDDGGGISDNKVLSTGRIDPDEGGMYPALVTWPSETYVYIVGKQSVDQTSNEVQLEFFRQDRDSFAQVPRPAASAACPTPCTTAGR